MRSWSCEGRFSLSDKSAVASSKRKKIYIEVTIETDTKKLLTSNGPLNKISKKFSFNYCKTFSK